MAKKRKYRIILLFLMIFPLLLLGLGLGFCSRKKGFSVDKISSKLTYNEIWETPPLSFEQKEHLIKEILSQKFHFLGSGNQCYSFVSADEKYVLKFFKMHKLLPKNWLTHFPFSLFEKYRLDNVEKKQHLFESTFKSFKDSYERLRDLSGLIYVHLNKSRDLKAKVEVIGSGGGRILIDLDSKEFAVQLKAQKIYDHLMELKEREKEEEVRLALRSFLELIAQRCKKGFGDHDIGIRNNYGFVDGRAIFIDCGHFFADESLKYPNYLQAEVLRATEKLSYWIEEYYPDIALVLYEEANWVLEKYLNSRPKKK